VLFASLEDDVIIDGVAVGVCEAGVEASPMVPSSKAASLTWVVAFDGAISHERVAASYECKSAPVLIRRGEQDTAAGTVVSNKFFRRCS
jgi:hypothetical protein